MKLFNSWRRKKRLNCLDKVDRFGNPVDLVLQLRNAQSLNIALRPCVPVQRTEENKDTGKCLVNDITNSTELE